MARWDDLQRAIEARDTEGSEQIWLELLGTEPDDVGRFLDAARRLAKTPGGKRQAGMYLWMLAESLKEKARHRDLIPVYALLAAMAPDDGTIRNGIAEATREAFPDRSDLDALLEKSGVIGGPVERMAEQAATLESYLSLQPGTYVFHRAGWGTGKIVDYLPARGRCVIDFKTKTGHEMDIDAAATRLERLDERDLRAMALSDPKGLRKWASEDPLEMIRQVLVRFNGSTKLRHVKDALVPDAVATSRWSTWWKEARKAAQLDPRFHVGPGRDAILEYYGDATVDFRTQVERVFNGCATVEQRQTAARDLLTTAKTDEEARVVLGDIVREQIAKATRPSTRLGWDLVLADLEDGDRKGVLETFAVESRDPIRFLATVEDVETRSALARAIVAVREGGADLLYEATLDHDDPVLADAAVDRFPAVDRKELVPRLLDHLDSKPALHPTLYAWYVKGLRRNRWDGRTHEPAALILRVLKVLDAVEYRSRRSGKMADKKGVSALADVLTSRNGQIVKDAAEQGDRAAARHLIHLVEQNRALKGRTEQRIQTMVLRAHPDALRTDDLVVVEEGEVHVGERLDRIYMTPAGIERMRTDRDRIVNEEMFENAKEIARAREFGDLSENAEYHAAREKQGLLQAKLDQMNSDLARAVPITADLVQAEAVSVGARVRLKDGGGEEITYVLLGPPDTDVANGVINYLTPLGQALMGRKVGDHVQMTVGEDQRDLEVLAIESSFE